MTKTFAAAVFAAGLATAAVAFMGRPAPAAAHEGDYAEWEPRCAAEDRVGHWDDDPADEEHFCFAAEPKPHYIGHRPCPEGYLFNEDPEFHIEVDTCVRECAAGYVPSAYNPDALGREWVEVPHGKAWRTGPTHYYLNRPEGIETPLCLPEGWEPLECRTPWEVSGFTPSDRLVRRYYSCAPSFYGLCRDGERGMRLPWVFHNMVWCFPNIDPSDLMLMGPNTAASLLWLGVIGNPGAEPEPAAADGPPPGGEEPGGGPVTQTGAADDGAQPAPEG